MGQRTKWENGNEGRQGIGSACDGLVAAAACLLLFDACSLADYFGMRGCCLQLKFLKMGRMISVLEVGLFIKPIFSLV